MTKTAQAQLNSSNPRQKRMHKNEISKDWISRLPDDLLVNIISQLPLEEAGRTSVLSSRWKHLWTFTPNLDFEDERKHDSPTKYIRWVNQVLKSHRCSTINMFRVHFIPLQESEITKWICAAFAKRVEILDLDLYCDGRVYTFPEECYTSVCSLSSIQFLRSLRFNLVNISGEMLEFFIHNCQLLDELHVAESFSLLRLKVVGSSVKLKHLHIRLCPYLTDVEISSPSLLSFKYRGHGIKFHIGNVPQLTDVSIRPGNMFDTRKVPQLKTLELDNSYMIYRHILPKLIHLKVWVNALYSSLFDLTSVMKTCPFLQKLILKLDVFDLGMPELRWKFPEYSHQHLKVTELHGFCGRQCDLALAFYLIECASNLKIMMIKPSRRITKKTLDVYIQELRAKSSQHVEITVG